MATEMDFLRRSCGRSKLERIRNDVIRMQMQMDRHIHEHIEKRQLTWFGHVKRMNVNRWPRKILEWTPLERRKRGRPRRSWRDDINQAMTARNLMKTRFLIGKDGNRGRRHGNSCRNPLYMYISFFSPHIFLQT